MKCGSSFYRKREVSNSSQARVWYIGLFVFMFSNQYLITYCNEHYATIPVAIVVAVYGVLFFAGLYRFRPKYTETKYIYVQDYDYPLAKQDALIVGSIMVTLVIIATVFLIL
jgi:hypothetical protein